MEIEWTVTLCTILNKMCAFRYTLRDTHYTKKKKNEIDSFILHSRSRNSNP